MNDDNDVESAPLIDPLRSGVIFRLNRAVFSAPRTPSSVSCVSAGATEHQGISAAGPSVGPFNAAYSARVRARFTELYRATPIPVSILYDTPQSRNGNTSAAISIGSADSSATTIAQTPSFINSGTGDFISPIDSIGEGIQIPVKTVIGGVDLLSPPPSRRHHRRTRDSAVHSFGSKPSENVGRGSDYVARIGEPAVAMATPVSTTTRTVKRLRPELVSPESMDKSARLQLGLVSSSDSFKVETHTELRPDNQATKVLHNIDRQRNGPAASSKVATVAVNKDEEEVLGDENSFASDSEGDMDDLDGMGEFLEQALADAGTDEEDECPADKRNDAVKDGSKSDELEAREIPYASSRHLNKNAFVENNLQDKRAKVVSTAAAALLPGASHVDDEAPVKTVQPKHVAPAQPRGRGATQVNSFLSMLPPPPPVSKIGGVLLSGSKSTPPPVPAEKHDRAVRSAPPSDKPVKMKKRQSDPIPALRLVQFPSRDIHHDSFDVELTSRSPVEVKKNAAAIAKKKDLVSKQKSVKKETDDRGVDGTTSGSTAKSAIKKSCHISFKTPEQPPFMKDDAQICYTKRLNNNETIGADSTASQNCVKPMLLGPDMSVWTTEELAALREGHKNAPLQDPNFWTLVAQFVNDWREKTHESYVALLALERLNKKNKKKKAPRKGPALVEQITAIEPVLLRSADDCQQRWFQSLNPKSRLAAKSRSKIGKITNGMSNITENSEFEPEKTGKKRLTKAKIREIVGKAVIGRPDDIFDAMILTNNGTVDSIIQGQHAESHAAINYYKTRDATEDGDKSASVTESGQKRQRTDSSTTPKRVLRSTDKVNSDQSSTMQSSMPKKGALIYTPKDLGMSQTPGSKDTSLLVDRMSTRSGTKRGYSPIDIDTQFDDVKRYLYSRPTAERRDSSGNNAYLDSGSAWAASYASNLNKRKTSKVATTTTKKLKKKIGTFSVEASFHNRSDSAVIEALCDGKISRRGNAKSQTDWKPKPSGRVKARIDGTTGRVITYVDDGEDDSELEDENISDQEGEYC